MATTDPRVDAYIEQAADFARPILKRVRKAFHKGCPEVHEAIKWGKPHFDHQGMLGGMAAFQAHVTVGFWRGKEIEDPAGLFEGVGETDMCAAKVTSVRDLPTQAVLADYVRRAAALNQEGRPKKKAAPKHKPVAVPRMPADFVAALKRKAAAKSFYDGLAPSHRRDYLEWILDAKRDATREKRIATAVAWLAEGKRRNWKYERPR